MRADIFIRDYALACALGSNKAAVAESLFGASPQALRDSAELSDGRVVRVGRISVEPAKGETRTNRIIAHCYAPLKGEVESAKARFGADRVGVVIGTCTSGIGEGGAAIGLKLSEDRWPEGFTLGPQQLGDAARYAAELAGAEGPYYSVSTACTSGGRALAAAARLIRAGLCDAVLCGGVDSLCDLTLNGFAALDLVSSSPSNPMSVNRNGLNLGEGGALFLLSREAGAFRLAGWGETVDGYHMSAPDPAGKGAEAAMRGALAMAQAEPGAIDFVHLHGTATKLNDKMEAGVVARVFGLETPCASTKPLTGHTLGAAGAVQAALCLMAMERGRLPPHVWDGERDPELEPIRLTTIGENAPVGHVLSASYAFGGNNAALVLAPA